VLSTPAPLKQVRQLVEAYSKNIHPKHKHRELDNHQLKEVKQIGAQQRYLCGTKSKLADLSVVYLFISVDEAIWLGAAATDI